MESKKEFFSVYINLLKTVIGVGLLLYPSLIKQYGILTVVLSSIISAFFSASGLILYILVNKQIGKKSTMSSIAEHIAPKFRKFVDFCVALKCFGVGIIYIIIVKDCITHIFIYFAGENGSCGIFRPNIILLILYILFSPLSFIDKMSKLRFTSLIGSISILAIIVLNIIRYLTTEKTYTLPSLPIDKNAITSFGSFVYGFTCHQNIFTIQNELKTLSVKSLFKVIACVMSTTLCIYWCFGIINCKILGDKIVGDNLFALYCQEGTFTSITVCFLFVGMLLMSFPLQSIPCRIYTISLIFPSYNDCKAFKVKFTIVLLIVSYCLSISDFGVKECMGLVGGSVSSSICFIICSVYYLKLHNKRRGINALAWATLMFGVAVFIGFIYKCFAQVYKP